MSIKKKIILSFIISASIMASLIGFEYLNYIEMRGEIRFLELTDTIRSKSLQLRRHEKNFLLYSPQKAGEESAAVHSYIEQLRDIVDENIPLDNGGKLLTLDAILEDYLARFEKIEAEAPELTELLYRTVPDDKAAKAYYPLVELSFLERPLFSASFLEDVFGIDHGNRLVTGLTELDADIKHLRKSGEEILEISKDLDKTARSNVDQTIRNSQAAILVFFPIFLVIGTATLFLITGDVAMRLKALTDVVEATGRGEFIHLPEVFSRRAKKDELGVLAEKFGDMGRQLEQREQELAIKNDELLQARKLAAIGTLASGVAHELNNPLNNIYLSAQVLKRESGGEYPEPIRQLVDDIVGQTSRVKGTVGDLLEFARMKEPEKRTTDLAELIRRSYGLVKTASSDGCIGVVFTLEEPGGGLAVNVDPAQMERVFINLLSNAVDSMDGRGELSVAISEENGELSVAVRDTGSGISQDMLDKVFEPFYTTKDRGTGLGLSITYNIVRGHDGDISVRSVKGEGTTFTVKLPKYEE